MRKGARVVVHRYDELLVRYPKGTGVAPYELHFLSGAAQASHRGHGAVIARLVPGRVVVAFVGWMLAAACSRGETHPAPAASRVTPEASRPVGLLDCVAAIAVRSRQGGLAPRRLLGCATVPYRRRRSRRHGKSERRFRTCPSSETERLVRRSRLSNTTSPSV